HVLPSLHERAMDELSTLFAYMSGKDIQEDGIERDGPSQLSDPSLLRIPATTSSYGVYLSASRCSVSNNTSSKRQNLLQTSSGGSSRRLDSSSSAKMRVMAALPACLVSGARSLHPCNSRAAAAHFLTFSSSNICTTNCCVALSMFH